MGPQQIDLPGCQRQCGLHTSLPLVQGCRRLLCKGWRAWVARASAPAPLCLEHASPSRRGCARTVPCRALYPPLLAWPEFKRLRLHLTSRRRRRLRQRRPRRAHTAARSLPRYAILLCQSSNQAGGSTSQLLSVSVLVTRDGDARLRICVTMRKLAQAITDCDAAADGNTYDCRCAYDGEGEDDVRQGAFLQRARQLIRA